MRVKEYPATREGRSQI